MNFKLVAQDSVQLDKGVHRSADDVELGIALGVPYQSIHSRIARRMDLRRAINEHVNASRELLYRLRSNEAECVTEIDLVILRTQLFLLDCEAANLREAIRHSQKPKGTETR